MKVFWTILCVGLMFAGVQGDGNSGANYNNSNTKTSYTQREKALFVADTLFHNEHVFRQLEAIFYAFKDDFLPTQPQNGSSGPLFADLVLGQMPNLLKNKDFQEIMYIITDEINRVNTTPVQQLAMANHWAQGNPNITNAMLYTYQHETNWYRMEQRLSTRKSVRIYFPYDKVVMPNKQCYEEYMDFMDSVSGGRYPTIDPNEFNFTNFWWALKMFDSYGKPSGGITKGNLYFIGSYDECRDVQAFIPANITVGNIKRTLPEHFSTKFCRAKFNISEDFIKSLNVETRGVKLLLNWGMCVPASCRSNDIATLFSMAPIPLPLNSVSCVEDPDISEDGSAIAAVVILCVFGGIVFVCTVLEGVLSSIPVNTNPQHGKINKGYLPDEDTIIKNGYAPETLELQSTQVPQIQSYKKLPPDYEKENVYQKLENGNSQKANGNTISPIEMSVAESKELEANGPVRPQPPAPAGPDSKDEVRSISPFIKAFSILTTIPKLLHAQKSASAINCVHGIRFISMLWIILGHTYNYGVISDATNPTTANLLDAAPLLKRFTFQGIMAAGFAVDTFFVLSAFLVTYLTLKDLKKKKVNGGYMAMFYFHRFWRLTPLYMIVLMTFSCLYKYFGDGPLWPEAIEAADYCKTNWWTNLLYVNNLVRNDQQCLGWSWYLANDMQFYVASPIFIFTIYWYAPVGLALTGAFCIAGVASAFWAENNSGGDMFTLNESPDYWLHVYTVPWTRMAAWMVGIVLGWVIYKTEKLKTFSLKKAVVGWVVALTVGLFVCYIPYTERKEGSEPWPRWLTALYESTTRPIFAACVSWVIFACHHNRGGFINDILSWNGIIPLSRLTYAAYLVHPTIMMMKVFSQRSLVYISDFDVAYMFMGHTCMTFMIAFVLSVVFEAPFLTLEKILFRRGH